MFLCGYREELKMKTWKHINYEQRKTISSCISHNYKLVNISKILHLDPTSISKEVKRNRIPIDCLNATSSDCKILKRWPYVCTNCKFRYKPCPFIKFRYDAKTAQKISDANLINSRRGLDINNSEFKKLDSIIKKASIITNLFIKLKLKIMMLLINLLLLYTDILTKVI